MVLRGFTDEAAQKDLFEIGKYIDGLVTFVESCDTPMCISIQGTWGTGKTSVMQIVKNKLTEKGNTQNIWFNTWQFSQFNMDNDLAFSFLSCLVNELSMSDKQKEKVTKTTQAIRFAQATGRLGKEVLLSVIDSKLGGRIAENLEQGLYNVREKLTEETNPATAVKELKVQFAQCVEETLTNANKDRVVIFVDDLDRLEPAKAVELLEVLKLFLDCRKCVFLLAIDSDVVFRGVEAKYGKEIGKEKGRSFFDKIVQVPFKLPVAEYNIKNYVLDCFEKIGMPCPKIEVDSYVELIKRSIGTNPRSMKRLFNSYLLLKIVVTEEILTSDKNKQLLFAVLCLQHSFENTYNYIVENRNSITMDELLVIADGECQDINTKFDGIALKETEIAQIQYFMEKFLQVIDADGDGIISETEIENFRNVLGISTITSSVDESKPVKRNTEVRDVKELNLDGKNPEEIETMIEVVTGIASDITCSMRNNKTVTVVFKNGTGTTFTEIYVQKNGYAVYCSGKSENPFKESGVAEILARQNINVKPQKNYAYVKLHITNPKESREDLQILAKACYDSYKE